MIGDLHCHTVFSDGSARPADILDFARRFHVDAVAVTDHDCMTGARRAAEIQSPVRLIRGLEISTFDYKRGRKVHILCYHPRETGELLRMCDETLRERQRASLEIIGRLQKKYPVDFDLVSECRGESPVIYKQHIILALMRMGYAVSVFGPLFSELFGRDGWARVEPRYPETLEAVKVAAASGGVCVLAHPGVYDSFDIVPELVELGVKGIEVFHPRQSEGDSRRAQELAERYGLIRTGGSDFHGMYTSRVNPFASRTTPDKELRRLLLAADIEL